MSSVHVIQNTQDLERLLSITKQHDIAIKNLISKNKKLEESLKELSNNSNITFDKQDDIVELTNEKQVSYIPSIAEDLLNKGTSIDFPKPKNNRKIFKQ